jgi:Leucine-rich repeat (LRR) protein
MLEPYPSYYTLAPGETKQLTAVGKGPSGEFLPGRTVTWASSSEVVATVDASGLVTAVGAGSATITASVEGHSSPVTIRVYDCSAQSEIPATECQALISLYAAMYQSDWRYSGSWVSGPDPCDWMGVTCDGGSVSILRLGSQRPGSIPFSIGDFSNLTRLDLSNNRLSGHIPSSIGTLTNLEFLSLASNDLSGPSPPGLGQLSKLTELHLYWNLLSGPIPPELSSLSILTLLRLNGNQLSGPIPPELGNLSNLQNLALFDNRLSGSIPAELGGLANLQRLSLFVNELSGRIPPELGNLSSLSGLELRDNQLSGPIPPELGNLSKLQSFPLYGNQLTGPIPLKVAQLGGLIQSNNSRSDCKFVPPGNTGLSMPETQAFRDADLDADGLICGVTIGFE